MRRRLAWLVAASLVAAAPVAVASPDPSPGPESPATGVRLPRARLGVAVIDIGPELRQYFGAPADRGVLVAKVLPGTPAASAGIAVGDVVVDVAGRPVDDAGDVIMAMAAMKDGEQATIRLVRKGAAQSVTATVRDSGAWQLPGPTWWPFRWLDEHWRSLPPAPAPGGRNT